MKKTMAVATFLTPALTIPPAANSKVKIDTLPSEYVHTDPITYGPDEAGGPESTIAQSPD